MDLTPAQRAFVRRETAISTAANLIIGGGVFLLLFGTGGPVPLGGFSGFALDFIPLSFMSTLVGNLVPSILAWRRVRRGDLAPLGGRRDMSLVLRALILAVVVTGVVGGSAITAFSLFSGYELPLLGALAIKAIYGAVLAGLAAPWAVRAGLRTRAPVPRGAAQKAG